MLKIGLTGGIGCGKSAVSTLFESLNVPVIDADIIAHQLVSIGQPALATVAQIFGAEIINSDGFLNRDKLREQIFCINCFFISFGSAVGELSFFFILERIIGFPLKR